MSEGYPPALGPPLPDEPSSPIPIGGVINRVHDTIQGMLDELNTKIKNEAGSTHIEAKISFVPTTHKPAMSTTVHPDRPNENVVRIPFMISYDVTDIKYHGIPYFDRNLGQSIEVVVSCNNWFTDQGKVMIAAHADRPYLDGLSFSEEALNFFIAHKLTDLVDSKIRQMMPDALTQFQETPLDCNCLGVTPGTAPTYADGRINYKKTRVRRHVPRVSDASVTFQSIKRLPARSPSGVLYNDVEDIQLTLYVNHALRTVQLQGMREGDERNLTGEPVGLGRDVLLVLICSVEQLSSSLKDTGFKVFTEEVNFGYGTTQKIIVTKTYWERQRLPDGRLTDPIKTQISAYEITVLINAPQPGGLLEPR